MAKKKPAKRITAHLFDTVFKKLLHLSNRAVVSFINGLFGEKYPQDSEVRYPSTETVGKDSKLRISDTILLIKDTSYHIEVQKNYDSDMVIRVFQYGYNYGVWKKTRKDASAKISREGAKTQRKRRGRKPQITRMNANKMYLFAQISVIRG
jgi:hypothetical protein